MLILKGKFFCEPPIESDVDPLHMAITAGVGRKIDKSGLPPGPWTPALLVAALDDIGDGEPTTALRTVQRWFSRDYTRISAGYVHLLARVFGCGDPDATIRWQKALAHTGRNFDRIVLPAASPDGVHLDNSKTTKRRTRPHFARLSEAAFIFDDKLAVPIALWAGFTFLAFFSYILGLESVEYSPVQGVTKQVGFLWAPSWSILPIVILPLYIANVSQTLLYWKAEGRQKFIEPEAGNGAIGSSWCDHLRSADYAFMVVFILCFLVIFVIQWTGIHLSAFLSGDIGNYMIDWNNVAVFRDGIAPISAVIPFSLVAYAYFGLLMWFLLTGFLFMIAVCSDYRNLRRDFVFEQRDAPIRNPVMENLFRPVYRATLFALLFIICIKLQSTYLITTAPDIMTWLLDDALVLLSFSDSSHGFLPLRSIPQLTTLILMGLCLLTYFVCSLALLSHPTDRTHTRFAAIFENQSWRLSCLIVIFLASNIPLIGEFQGFSVLLLSSTVLAAYSFYSPPSFG